MDVILIPRNVLALLDLSVSKHSRCILQLLMPKKQRLVYTVHTLQQCLALAVPQGVQFAGNFSVPGSGEDAA